MIYWFGSRSSSSHRVEINRLRYRGARGSSQPRLSLRHGLKRPKGHPGGSPDRPSLWSAIAVHKKTDPADIKEVSIIRGFWQQIRAEARLCLWECDFKSTTSSVLRQGSL